MQLLLKPQFPALFWGKLPGSLGLLRLFGCFNLHGRSRKLSDISGRDQRQYLTLEFEQDYNTDCTQGGDVFCKLLILKWGG